MSTVLREALKTLIEVSTSVEKADAIISEYGFKTTKEKIAFLKETFNVCSYNEPDENTYQAMLSAIINQKWNPS